MNIRIEPMTYENLEKTVQAAKEIFHYTVLPLADDFESALSETKLAELKEFEEADALSYTKRVWAKFWVALTDDNQVAGFNGIYLKQGDPESLWIPFFGVREKFRRYGIGSKLMDFIIEEAKKEGAHNLRLQTTTHELEESAQAFYEKKGFKEMKDVKRVPFQGYEVFCRELKL